MNDMTPPARPSVQVAPLDWDWDGRAMAIMGHYELLHFPPTGAWMWQLEVGATIVARGGDKLPGFPNREAAAADAERDHEERLQAWIRPAPKPDYTVTDASIELFRMCLAKIEEAEAQGFIDTFAGDSYRSLANLAWMCRTAIADGPNLPEDKVSRWLGFVQGGLAMRGLLDVGKERDVSRTLFHRAYKAMGRVPPASLAREAVPAPMMGPQTDGVATMDYMMQAGPAS